MSVLREAFSRLFALEHLTLDRIVEELNQSLRRKEMARIYHWHQQTGQYPPRRDAGGEPRGQAPAGALASPAEDMAHFMIAHLQDGEYNGKRILSAATARQSILAG